jgi:hypothetical protein
MLKNIKGLKRLPLQFPVYVVEDTSASFGGKMFKRNALIVWYKGEMVYCNRFPRNYAGNNPMLEVCYYDFDFQCWMEAEPAKNMYTKLLWAVWRSGGYKKTSHEINSADCAELMKHDRRHKRGSGQREITTTITDYDCCHTPSMRPGRWGHIEGYWGTYA